MKAKRHDAKEGEHHVFFADIKRSGNTSVFVNGLEHIQGFQDGQELCDAAGKEDNADDFKNLIQGGPIFKGQAGMNLHGCFRSRCHSNGHNDEFAIFPRDLNIFFVAVYILSRNIFTREGSLPMVRWESMILPPRASFSFWRKARDRFSFSSSVCFTVGHLILYIFF